MSADADVIQIVEQFDRLPEDALVTTRVMQRVLGGKISDRTIRRAPPVPRRQISERRFGFRVGDIRALVRGSQPA